MANSVLLMLSKKLGIASKEINRKASEFNRMLEVRCGSSLASLNLSSTATSVICLEIAANSSGLAVSKPTAIQLSGLTKKLYTNAYKGIECILGKQKKISLQDFAVMFGCLSSVTFAEQVLKSYKSSQSRAVDFDQPVFTLATLYIVCRSMKIRLDKSKMISQANVKRSTFDKVCKQIQPILNKMTEKSKETDLKRPYSWLEDSSGEQTNAGPESKKIRRTESEREEQENADYETWKRKMLSETGIAER